MSPEEFSSEEEEEDAASESVSADRMVRAASQMSKVLKEIYKEKKEKKANTLDSVLDRAESGLGRDSDRFKPCSRTTQP